MRRPPRAGIRDDFPGGHGARARETGELERRLPKPPPWRDLIEAVAGRVGSWLGQFRRMPADRPYCQALPSGSATKRVPPFDFTRNNSVRLPSLRASAICVRTSAGLETDLPLTSRMTSPTWKP